MSRATEAAQAVTDLLNDEPAGTWGQTIVVERRYVPVLDLATIGDDLSIQVVPRADRSTGLARAGPQLHDLQIDIGIQKRLEPGTDPQKDTANPELDDLADFAEAVSDFFEPGMELTGTRAVVVESTIDPVYAPEHLVSHNVFTSIVRLGLKLV